MVGETRKLTVQLLEGELLGLTDEAEDHEPGNQVQTSVETDWTQELAMGL